MMQIQNQIMNSKQKYLLYSIVFISLVVNSCHTPKSTQAEESISKLEKNMSANGNSISMKVKKGVAHNHPSFAIWVEDLSGKHLQTLYVTSFIATGVYKHGDKSGNKWKPGEVRRPASLPYWAHKRGIKAADGLYIPSAAQPIPDAYSGATPSGSFELKLKSDNALSLPVKILLEVNQPWDWNEYWTNNKYPDDIDYETSCQPSLVYEALIQDLGKLTPLSLVGHSHYSGKDGSLNSDLQSITTAKQIFDDILVIFE